MRMYRGMVASGGILALFGVFLVITDLYVPMGVSVFGLPIAIAGGLLLVFGFLRGEPQQIEPEPGKKFCWYCMTQIPKDALDCPNCSLPQHDTHD